MTLSGTPPAGGDDVEIASRDGRWGLRATVVGFEYTSEMSMRVTVDRRTVRVYATPPVEDADE